VKFDVHRVDNMVIQSIALLDQLDKDINLFGMRIREWYSYHFPELYTMVRDQYNYLRCAMAILDRKNLDEDVAEKLKGELCRHCHGPRPSILANHAASTFSDTH
jgi:nucleolar protein 56